MSSAASLPLQGRGVLVTRPAAQAQTLTERLEALGARAFCFPLIDILPLEDIAPLRALAGRLDTFDLVFFVSANAVAHALDALPPAIWPSRLRVSTVGPGTARTLSEAGFAEVLLPRERFDSEGVLELPEFAPAAVAGKRLLVLRGDGGRELLAETLRARGAEVEQISCYRRAPPAADPSPLIEAARRGELHALSLTSSEGLENLIRLLGEARDALLRLPVFVPHERIARRAKDSGAAEVHLVEAGDDGLIAGLVAFFAAADAGRSR